jgi:hypothetical protein
MNTLAYGISMQYYQSMHGSGALFSTLGMNFSKAFDILQLGDTAVVCDI